MTEKQEDELERLEEEAHKEAVSQRDETCENCGHEDLLHEGTYKFGECLEIGCPCKKFIAKKGLDKKSKGCGKEGVDDYGNIITCGEGILCDACSKAKNHSPRENRTTVKSSEDTPSGKRRQVGSPTEGTFNLSERIWYNPNNEKFWYPAEDVKEFIRNVEFWGRIDLAKDTLTIKYSKFKKLAGEDLSK